MQPRLAVPGDAPELARLRRLMFESMGLAADSAEWLAAAEQHLRNALTGAAVLAVVIDDPDRRGLAASGIIEFHQRIPSPVNPTGRLAHISSMSTDVQWRRRGLARAVLSRLLEEARRRRVARVELHATPDGLGLYTSVGFVSGPGGPELSLDLEDRRDER